LMEARERGFAVPPELMKGATGYLQTIAATDVEGLSEAGVRAYAIYVLTRGGMMTGAFAAAAEKHLVANHPKVWRRDLAGLYLAATYRLLKQDGAARDILDALKFGEPRVADADWYYDQLAYDAQALYILSRHFPERAARVSAPDIDAIVEPIFRGRYNTYSSAWSILALEAYSQTAAAATAATAGALAVHEIVGGQARALTLPRSLLPETSFSALASAVRFEATGPFGVYWVLAEAGFDRQVSDKPESHSVEILRTYEGADGKPATRVKLGDEITAIVRLRTLGRAQVNHLAIVDLLPGGFEPVVQQSRTQSGGGDADDDAKGDGERQGANGEAEDESEADHEGAGEPGGESTSGAHASGEVQPASSYALPIALPGATFPLEFGDVREDRVVLYGSASSEMKELRYVIKATNVGSYAVPPVQATALYDSTVFGRGGAGKISVVAR